MRIITLSLIAFLQAIPSLARTQAPAGAVTGHVTLAGSNLPVRNARVVLEPVPQLNAKPQDSGDSLGVESNHTIVETLPDGSFHFLAVKPGSYYMLVEKQGCLSPISSLTRADLEHPSEQSLVRMAQLLAGVTVTANKTSDVKIQIHPGAVLAGTVRFDDGSPDIGARVLLMTQDSKGQWTAFRTTSMGSYMGDVRTDDRGQYRISGLPAGDYLLRVPLEINEGQANFIFGGSGSSSSRSIFSLMVYQSGTFQPSAAKPISLTEAQASESNDIEVPLAKMHSLSGTLVEARTGRLINAGKVAMVSPGSGDILATSEVTAEDGQFHFLFVPEGTYTLRVTQAREVIREVIPYPKGTMPPTHTEEKTIKTYAEITQPLIMNGDQTGLSIAVPPATQP